MNESSQNSSLSQLETIIDIEALSKIPNIRRGGCGILALAIGRKLKQLGTQVDLLFCSSWKYKHEGNSIAMLEENPSRFNPPSHILVTLDDKALDEKGLVDVDYYRREYPYIDIFPFKENILLSGINGPGWNEMFNRKKHVKTISEILDVDLSDVNIY